MTTNDIRDDLVADRAIRPKRLAAWLGLPASTIYAKIARDEIAVVRIGRCLSIPPEEGRRLLGIADRKAA